MKRLVVAAALVTFDAASATEFSGLQHSYYRNGQRFDFSLTCEQVRAAPRWTPEDQSPSLSPRDAKDLAEAEVAKIFPSEAWRLSSIAIHPVCDEHYWYYAVAFSQPEAGVSFGDQLTIPVLMDATTAPAIVSPWPQTSTASETARPGDQEP